MYTKNSIVSSRVNIPTNNIENIAVEIKDKDNNWILIQCIYRSPNSTGNFMEEIRELLELKANQYHHFPNTIIVGDFNFREINWETESTNSSENHPSNAFLELVKDNFLQQHVNKPTRIRGNDQPSILDLVLSDNPEHVGEIIFNSPLGNSNHVCLSFTLKINFDEIKTRVTRNYCRGNYETIKTNLSACDWDDILSNKTTLEAWSCFADTIHEEIRQHIPESKATTRNYRTPWMTETALEAVRRKRRQWKKLTRCRNDINKNNYEQAKKRS